GFSKQFRHSLTSPFTDFAHRLDIARERLLRIQCSSFTLRGPRLQFDDRCGHFTEFGSCRMEALLKIGDGHRCASIQLIVPLTPTPGSNGITWRRRTSMNAFPPADASCPFGSHGLQS